MQPTFPLPSSPSSVPPALENPRDDAERDKLSTPSAPRRGVPFERGQAWLRDADLLLVQTGGPIPWFGRGLHGHVATVARWDDDWFALETRPGGGRAVPLSAFLEQARRRVDVFRPDPDGRWPEYRPEKCVAFMRRAVAARYDWLGVAAAALARVPFVRLLWSDDYFEDRDTTSQTSSPASRSSLFASDAQNSDRLDKTFFPAAKPSDAPTCERDRLDEIWRFNRELARRAALHCAEARAFADRYAGVDSVPMLSDRFVEPADLARSPFYRYQFAFAPPADAARRKPCDFSA